MLEKARLISLASISANPIHSANSKLTIPVRPLLANSSIYKHIRTIPAADSQQAIPLFKLNALDAILDQLIKIDKNYKLPQDTNKENKYFSSDLLYKLHSDLKIKLAQNNPFQAGLISLSGLIFSFKI